MTSQLRFLQAHHKRYRASQSGEPAAGSTDEKMDEKLKVTFHRPKKSFFPFLALPAEIRLQIYQYLLRARHTRYMKPRMDEKSKRDFRVCRCYFFISALVA